MLATARNSTDISLIQYISSTIPCKVNTLRDYSIFKSKTDPEQTTLGQLSVVHIQALFVLYSVLLIVC